MGDLLWVFNFSSEFLDHSLSKCKIFVGVELKCLLHDTGFFKAGVTYHYVWWVRVNVWKCECRCAWSCAWSDHEARQASMSDSNLSQYLFLCPYKIPPNWAAIQVQIHHNDQSIREVGALITVPSPSHTPSDIVSSASRYRSDKKVEEAFNSPKLSTRQCSLQWFHLEILRMAAYMLIPGGVKKTI